MQITTFPAHRPARVPDGFDYSPIDKCEEAMWAPGSDVLVRALVGDRPVHVTFDAAGHHLDYRQTADAVQGQIDGRDFTLAKRPQAGGLEISGDTSGGAIQVNVKTDPSQVESITGHAGKMGFKHRVEPWNGHDATISGKFD